MRISKYIHSCLLVENRDDKILFDPGKFSFIEGLIDPDQFEKLSAIILTHYHPDHVDEDALKTIVGNNSSAVVLASAEIQARLSEKGIAAEVFETGSRAVGSFDIAALEAPHPPILGEDPPPRNIAYVVDDVLLHPGDSLADSLHAKMNTYVLALPVMAPWMTELEAAKFGVRMRPKHIIPIHDGYSKAFFLEQRYENFKKHFSGKGIEFHSMNKAGDFVEIEPRSAQHPH